MPDRPSVPQLDEEDDEDDEDVNVLAARIVTQATQERPGPAADGDADDEA